MRREVFVPSDLQTDAKKYIENLPPVNKKLLEELASGKTTKQIGADLRMIESTLDSILRTTADNYDAISRSPRTLMYLIRQGVAEGALIFGISDEPMVPLSDPERAFTDLIMKGLKHGEIAAQLKISIADVRKITQNIFTKTQSVSKYQLAGRLGYIDSLSVRK